MPIANPIRYTQDVETLQTGEQETVDAINRAFDTILETTASDHGHAVRAVHAKSHGILRGTMRVHEGLAPELAQGMFSIAAVHPVIMRLSTNAGDILPDAIALPRGLAVKVLDVSGDRLAGAEGNTQDFVMVNGRVFQAKNAEKFEGSLKLLAKTADRLEGAKKVASSVMQSLNSALATIGVESPSIQSLGGAPNVDALGETYYSVTAFRFGDHIAKFRIKPASTDLLALSGKEIDTSVRDDAIREAVQAEMQHLEGEWMFQVQLCRNLESQPVEDPTVEWREDDTPFETVATITAEPQDSWSQENVREVDDGMRFSVWTGIEAHRPLGNINRARKGPYEHSARFRSAFNGCPMHEPMH